MSLDEHEHGPITEYHGTIDLPKVISEGIRGGNPKTRSKHYVPEGLREEDLVSYTHPDREMALAFAQDRAKRLKLDPDKVGVVGVRGSNLPEAVEHEEPQGGIFGGTNSFVRPGGISPEYLIQASEDKMKPKKKGIVMIISVGPKMPRKPTDESTPDKEVKKAIPEEWDEQADIQSYRVLPTAHLENAAAAMPIPTLEDAKKDPSQRKTGMSRQYEEQIQALHDEDPMGGVVPLPGFKEMDYGGPRLAGSWVMPSDLHSFRNPDFTFDPRVTDHSLIGIADTPNFYRTGRETGGLKNATEGFHYGGFDPEDLYRIPMPPDMDAHGIARVADDIQHDRPSRGYERDAKARKLLERLEVPKGKVGLDKWRENKRRPVTTEELMDMVRAGSIKLSGEPMDIAFQLLKEDIDYQDEDYIHPHEQIWNDEADEQLVDTTNSLWDYIESMHPQDKLMMLNQMDNPMLAMGINTDPRNRADMTDEETEKYINDAIWEMMFDAWQDSQLEMPGGIDYDLGGNRKSGEPGDPVRAHAVHPSQWKKLASEPMEIAYQLLKGRKHGWRGVGSRHRNFFPMTRGEKVLVKPSKRQQMLNRRTSNSIGLERTLTHAQRDEQEAMERMLNSYGNHTNVPKEELVHWGNWLPTSQTVKVKNSRNQRRHVPTKATKQGRNVRVSTSEPEPRRLTRRQLDATSLPSGTSLLAALEHERFMNVLGDMANYNQVVGTQPNPEKPLQEVLPHLPNIKPQPNNIPISREPQESVEQEPAFHEKLSDAMVDASKGLFDEDGRLINTGEPMGIAMRLLKGASINQTDDIYHYPHELDYDNLDSYLEEYPSATLGDMVTPYLQGQFTPNTSTSPPSHQEERPVAGLTRNQQEKTVNAPFPMDISQTQGIQQTLDEGISSYHGNSRNKEDYGHINNAVRVLSRGLRGNPAIGFKPKRIQSGWNAGRNVGGGLNRNKKNEKLMNLINTPVTRNVAEMVANPPMMSSKTIAASEPMGIAFQLLKGRNLSPAARKHKLEYDTKYQSSPKRIKYRVDLNRERRRRGIYGSGNHKDVSHTQGGKLTLENEHDNRARHFKGKGTLRRVKVKK